MNWLVYPIIAAFLWATVNHLDKYLLDKYCKNREIGGLIIFSSLIGLPVVLLIYIFDNTVFKIDFTSAAIMIIAGALYLLGIVFYLYALDIDETSVVAPQALMLTVFTGILGNIFLGENISIKQFIGIAIILAGALTLSLEISSISQVKLKSKVFLLMLVSSFFIGTQTFLFKYTAIDLPFWQTTFWLHMGFVLIAVIFTLFIKNYRKQFLTLIKTNPAKIILINLTGETLTILGNISFYYGLLFVPLAIAEGVTEGIQPIFVLLIGIIITILMPEIGRENIKIKNLSHKLISIMIMIYGLFLVLS